LDKNTFPSANLGLASAFGRVLAAKSSVQG